MLRNKFQRSLLLISLAAGAVAFAPLAWHAGHAHAAARPAADTPSSTQKDQVDLNVTVYNSNVALVRDVRQLSLPSGDFSLKFEDVAASINPATVHFRSLSEPAHLSVIEQNYEYDLLDPGKLLQKYVGKEVTLVHRETENNSTKWVETKALLLADNNGPVWKIGGEIVTGMTAESYRFADLPENLYSKPTLLWMLQNSGPKSQKVEASYLTSNMNWNADYVLTVNRDDKAADLVLSFLKIFRIGKNIVDSGSILVLELESCVDHDDVVSDFNHRHVHSDFLNSSKGNDSDIFPYGRNGVVIFLLSHPSWGGESPVSLVLSSPHLRISSGFARSFGSFV